ncbi:flippase-like domain-containing protein [Candidatus Nomurabacteria bacterium]|uniref:Flippase-like domain-containing protein n=1 Tax=candidate division WWE3 bacterium TaxID=2053526 RepID=A0A955IWD4_UNCKA|nr:flippase-like domain-containing protein [candidate division WWE3 bacterium]MCB9824148.1 flippase-like domain-containing protein [Candidatus Nomurabacteria bacterium]MCB9826881.1 flippase-like domain-containing protein [Candidatus Nomurabacteria bacterium]MCB9828089.1 flippase-like domain-containing protein [Candidatus Nomurabacteria bacterium]
MKLLKHPAIKILFSLVLITVIVLKVDREELVSNIRLMDYRFIPLIVLLLVLNYVVSSYRWKALLVFKNLKPVNVAFLTRLYFIGAFFNNFMPTSMGGDVYKVLRLGKKIGNNAHAFTATFMERFTGFVALILISYFGLIRTWGFWVEMIPESLSINPILLKLFETGVILGFWIASFAGFIALKVISSKIPFLSKIYNSLLEYRSNRRTLFFAVLTSFVVQFIAIFTQYFIFISLGADLKISYALFTLPIVTLASFFIPSLNGVGVQDALYIQLFSLVGISTEAALSASIIYHLSRLGVSLIGGVLYASDKE